MWIYLPIITMCGMTGQFFFHFLTNPQDRQYYVQQILHTVCPEFGTSKEAETNHESVWNAGLNASRQRHHPAPSTVGTVSLSGSDLRYARRVM